MEIQSPAKLNLHLQVGGRRPDGFHDIESLFLALNFGDTLHFQTTQEPLSLEICMDWQPGSHAPGESPPAIPPEKNIISKAVSLFRGRTGSKIGLKITVKKRIPPGGGLGGGSSNAAATFLALNRLFSPEMSLDNATLAKMGTFLGSDVPFFLESNQAAAWVSGRGEAVQPLELPESAQKLSLVLVNPGFHSDTAQSYRLLDQWRALNAPMQPPNPQFFREAFSDPPRKWPFFNDFLPVLLESEAGAAYRQILGSLRELGADFSGLSGSGSTCFGVFSGAENAAKAERFLSKHWTLVNNTFFACTLGNTILQ